MKGQAQVDADRAGEREGAGVLAFSDQHRQIYSWKVPPPGGGEFFVGGYATEGPVIGEFRIVLHELGDPSGRLDPQLCVFGTGAGALAALLSDAGPDLAALLAPVADHVEFSRRLLALGITDHSDRPLEDPAA
ncbi:MAG: hypothetical protein J0H06_03240 [Actinobacteria bacterium]|nr:hypothetical protein [Actinomycetota bacterium]